MRFLCFVAAAAALFWAPASRAEVTSASASSFVIEAEAELDATPAQVWRHLTRINRWWNDEHTYSGAASNMRLEARAGGCWCERWGDGQSVEHMRIIAVTEIEGTRTLRAAGGLGPLQEMGVSGVMTFTVSPHPNGAKLSMTYRVSGDPSLNLNAIAALVDSVLMAQFERLRRYSTSGTPD